MSSPQLKIQSAGITILLVFCPPQAASGPRVLCIPQIILTECTSGSPSLPESSLEELDPRTVPTPRPRTLAGSRRVCHGSQALLGLAAEVLRPRSSSLSRKEQTILRSPDNAEAGVLCPWGPSLDETQPAETHSEETSPNSGCDSQACSRGEQAVGSGHPVQDATPLRMDSLEETLQELEATLSEMGTNTTMTCLSVPQSPPSSPQVAASPCLLLPSCSSLWACRVERVGPRKLGRPPSSPLSLFQPTSLREPCFQARAYGQSQGRPGSRLTQDSALLFGRESGGLWPCLLSVNQGIKLSPLLHPFLPLLSLTLSVAVPSLISAPLGPQSLSGKGCYMGKGPGARCAHRWGEISPLAFCSRGGADLGMLFY